MSAGLLPLVGYDSSSESDGDTGEDGSSQQGCSQAEKDGPKDIGIKVRMKNFLLESGSGSSSESEENHDEQTVPEIPDQPASGAISLLSPHLGNRLPPPPPSVISGTSVFDNPFKERATEQLSILQKHVPLTTEIRPSLIGGRKICITYRRDGRCRFGRTCKFAHDSDLQTPGAGQGSISPDHLSGLSQLPLESSPNVDKGKDSEELPEVRRKRRVGLSDSLTPPKRALKQYKSQRKKEGVTPPS